MLSKNPYWYEPIWLAYKYGVLNRIHSNLPLTPEEQVSVTKCVKSYENMVDTMRIYDDLVAKGATAAELKQFDDDLMSCRFAGYDDPVNEYRRAYGLSEV